MKTIHPLLATIIVVYSVSRVAAIPVQQALKEKKIALTVQWKNQSAEENSSLRHGNNLLLTMKNRSNAPIEVEIPEGFLFTAMDSTRQNMLVTEEMDFVLLPQQVQVKAAYGYCCEANDRSPSENDLYAIRKMAGPELRELAGYVSKEKLRGYAVQRAVWCVSDRHDLANISDEDTAVSRKLIGFTGKLKQLPSEEIAKALNKAAMGGRNFEKMIHLQVPVEATDQIWIVIQNINNNTLQTVLTKQQVEPGIFDKRFGVSSLDLGKGNFFIRIYSTKKSVQTIPFSLDV